MLHLLTVAVLVCGMGLVPGRADQVNAAPAAADDEKSVVGQPVRPAGSSVINFRDLAEREAAHPQPSGEPQLIEIPFIPQVEPPSSGVAAPTGRLSPSDTTEPDVASPSPSANFNGLEDGAKVGTGGFTIPPDTMGAVGPNHLMVTLNNNYRIENKADGSVVSTVSINTFWAGTGATSPFDPKTLYDGINNRWIVCAVSEAQTANSSVLIGVSQTSDPSGGWFLFRVDADAGNTIWADYPGLGYNKNWVAASMNMFNNSNNVLNSIKIWAFDYPSLRAGTLNTFVLSGGVLTSDPNGHFTIQPAVTHSATEETLYAPNHIGSAAGTYRLNTITGAPPAAPTFTSGTVKSNPLGGWTQPGGSIVPQQCTAGCPGTILRIDSGDARMMNAVFRGGSIWYAQTVGLPAGGLARTAAQWVQLNTSGDVTQAGRVDDPTATATNGGNWYVYPTIAVNQDNDVLLGFSQMASDQFASAGYTFRKASDANGTMRDPVIYKAGEDYYQKTFSGTRNRWGDYSATVVDPSDNRTFWTLQEYARPRNVPNGLGSNDSRWGTWWAKVIPPVSTLTLTVQTTGAGTVTGPGINCGGDCSEALPVGTFVNLTATPAAGSVFLGWSGVCSTTSACAFTINSDVTVTANFGLGRTLTITKSGNGVGTVTGTGINCGADCSETFAPGASVTLTAAPTSGSTFLGWTGDCAAAGTNPTCNQSMTSNLNVGAKFGRAASAVVGVQTSKVPGSPPRLSATLSAPAGCGPISNVQFGQNGVPFQNATVTVTSPAGPANQTSGFSFNPAAATVTFTVTRVVQSGSATVTPIIVTDACGTWTTLVGGGADAFQ